MALNYDETKSAATVHTELLALTGLTAPEIVIRDNAAAACPAYAAQVVHAVVNDLGWFVVSVQEV